MTTREADVASKGLTRDGLRDIEEHARRRSEEGGFTNVWNADAFRMIEWIRRADDALREIGNRQCVGGCECCLTAARIACAARLRT